MQRTLVILMAAASLGVTALIVLTVLQSRGGARPAPKPPQVLFELPAFALTDQQGEPFNSEQLAGKVWVADFIFTNCAGPCPMMTSVMAGLQRDLSARPGAGWGDVRLVSVSVDPQRDTPEALREYARLAQADTDHWFFLTGPRDDVWSLVNSGFKLPVGQAAAGDTQPIFHSQKFVLVDRQRRVRGYYDGLTADGRRDLLRDLAALVRE